MGKRDGSGSSNQAGSVKSAGEKKPRAKRQSSSATQYARDLSKNDNTEHLEKMKNKLLNSAYGFDNNSAVYRIIYSNGGRIVNVDSNGKYYLDMSDNVMEAWDYTRRIFVNYNKPAGEGANWDYYKADFLSGATAFYNDQEYDAQPNGMLADMKDDWGMVCFPLGPKGDGKYFTLNQDNMLVIPSCYSQDKVNKIMKIYDFWSDTVPGYDDPDAWKEYYYAAFRDTRAVDETMQYMMDNSKSWNAWLIPGLNYAPLSWSICAGADVAETYESMKNELQATIDEAMNK